MERIKATLWNSNKICASAWLYSKAVEARVINDASCYDIDAVFSLLDQAISLNPNEAAFWFWKAYWYEQWNNIKDIFQNKENIKCFEIEKYREWLEKAIERDPNWDEPKKLLQESLEK